MRIPSGAASVMPRPEQNRSQEVIVNQSPAARFTYVERNANGVETWRWPLEVPQKQEHDGAKTLDVSV